MSAGAIEAGRAFVRILANDTDLVKGLKRAQNKLKLFAASTGELGKHMLGLSAAIGAPMVAGAKAFADFETAMAQVATLVEDKQTFMPGFTEGIKNLAIEFGESKEVLAAGLRDILGAAIDPAKAMDVLTVSVRAAKAALTDTATATDAITTVLAAYGLSVNKAGDVSDWLFRVADRGKTTFPELAAGIGNVATTAATAGVGLDELGAMLAILTRSGIKTDNAITSLNSIITTFLRPSDEAKEIARQLGFELSAATLQAEGLAGVFQRIAKLPPEAIAKLFPESRALKGILPALRNMQGFEKDMKAMADRAGATENAYNNLANTMTTKFGQVREAIIQAAEEIGEALAVDLKAGADAIKEIGKYVADWIERHQALVNVVGKSVLIVGALGGALMAVAGVAKTAAWAIGGVAMAGKAASVSLAFLVAHPAIAALAAIAAVAVAVGVAMDYAAESCLSLSGAQSNLLATGDKERKQAVDALNRLQRLSQQEKLSNKEKQEAATIIDKLQGRYGDLGLSMDETSGKIRGVTSAFEEMAKLMRGDTEKQIRSALLEASTNATLAIDEINRLKDVRMSKSAKEVETSRLRMEADKWNAKAKDLQKRLEDLKTGDTDAALGNAAGGPEVGSYDAAVQADKIAEKSVVDFKKKLAERLHQTKLDMMDDENKREMEAIKYKHATEIEEAKKANNDIVALKKVQAEEIKAIEYKQAKERADQERKIADDIKRLQLKAKYDGLKEATVLLDMEEAIEIREAQKRGESTKGIAEKYDLLRQETQKEQADKVRGMQDEIIELEIQSKYTGLEQQIKLLQEQRRQAIRDAEKNGDPIDLINKRYDLVEKMTKQQAYAKLPGLTGTFSAHQAAQMRGSVEEKQLKAQQQIAVNTARTATAINGLGRLR